MWRLVEDGCGRLVDEFRTPDEHEHRKDLQYLVEWLEKRRNPPPGPAPRVRSRRTETTKERVAELLQAHGLAGLSDAALEEALEEALQVVKGGGAPV